MAVKKIIVGIVEKKYFIFGFILLGIATKSLNGKMKNEKC